MSPRKLTEDDKKNMLELYRNSKATTSTLAEEFGVSSSTVSRFLKNSLSEGEYEELIQQKRLARPPRGGIGSNEAQRDLELTEIPVQTLKTEKKPSQKIILPTKTTLVEARQDKPEPIEPEVAVTVGSNASGGYLSDSTISSTPASQTAKNIAESVESTTESIRIEKAAEKPSSTIKLQKKVTPEALELEIDEEDVNVVALSAMLGEEIDDLDLDDEDEDEDDEEDEEDDSDRIDFPHTNPLSKDLKILPLSAASLPRICYLVVDRAAELIVKPLQEFADLGSIPEEEIQQKTLPVFDNHRIAKRFSHRREKVIKVPDGKILQKTSPYLYEKGITRLLIRGQIYAIYES